MQLVGLTHLSSSSSSSSSYTRICHGVGPLVFTYPEVSSKVCHDSFCQLGNSVSLPWVIYYKAFYLHVVSNFSCIPVICLKLVLFLIPLQNRECAACLKYSVLIVVEKIYIKCNIWRVAVGPSYI